MKTLLTAMITMLIACNYSNHDAITTDSVKLSTDTLATDHTDSSKIITDQDSAIHVKFAEGASSITIKGMINGIKEHVTVYVPVKKDQLILALLVPEDTLANVRINQVIMPNGKSDGPFNRDINKKIPADGTCKIIIAENLMQEPDWKGKFTLSLRLE